jgi:hypothetical protein
MENSMTYKEYLEILEKYNTTDSIREKDELGDKIETAANALLHTLVKLYATYGKEFVDDSDYRTDRGWVDLDDCGEKNVYLRYKDRWQYGGECDIGISVPMKYLDVEERNNLENELKKQRKS